MKRYEIIDLDFSEKSLTLLEEMGIEHLDELENYSFNDLLNVKWMNLKSLREIEDMVSSKGYILKNE